MVLVVVIFDVEGEGFGFGRVLYIDVDVEVGGFDLGFNGVVLGLYCLDYRFFEWGVGYEVCNGGLCVECGDIFVCEVEVCV